MIDVAYKDIESKNKLEAIRHADLKVSILNAPHSRRKDDRLYKIGDFLDKETLGDLRPKNPKPISKKDQASMWSAAGNAYVRQFEKK